MWHTGNARHVLVIVGAGAGDELGGHIVLGHVDGVGGIAAVHPDGESLRLSVDVPADLARYIASKGSVALDGISLTVNEVAQKSLAINIIPHTLTHTTLGAKKIGDRVNLEVDLIARYVARLMERDWKRDRERDWEFQR